MSDMEEKAREYADEVLKQALLMYDKDASEFLAENAYHAYLQGMKDALGSQWRDAEKEKPEDGEQVLIMSDDSQYPAFGEWHGDYWEREDADVINRSDDEYYPFKVIAWLPIPKYKPNGE